MGELLKYDMGLVHYLYIKTMREVKFRKDNKEELNIDPSFRLADMISGLY